MTVKLRVLPLAALASALFAASAFAAPPTDPAERAAIIG